MDDLYGVHFHFGNRADDSPLTDTHVRRILLPDDRFESGTLTTSLYIPLTRIDRMYAYYRRCLDLEEARLVGVWLYTQKSYQVKEVLYIEDLLTVPGLKVRAGNSIFIARRGCNAATFTITARV